MGLEIRPAKPEEMEEFNRVIRTVFAEEPGFDSGFRAELTLCAFSDGKLATSYASQSLTMQFTDASIPVAGISAVATLPVYRRRDYLRKVTAAHFNLLHERGEQPIAILCATMAAIYQRYGYAVVSTRKAYTFEPRYLQFSQPREVPGDFQEVGDEEMGLLLDMYHRFGAQRTGFLRRSGPLEVAPGTTFSVLVFPPSPKRPTMVVYRENGEPLGYMIYTLGRAERPVRPLSQRLTVRDLVWLSASAYQAMWAFLANMDLVDEIVWGRVPPDDPLPHLLLEPRMLNATSGDGLLARIVDVERALPKRRYSEEGTLTFEIIDDLCPWNGGRWKMETSAAGTNVSRSTGEPQLVMPISTLAMLVFGQISASEAARMGRLDVSDYNALDRWDKVMSTKYRPFCADIF